MEDKINSLFFSEEEEKRTKQKCPSMQSKIILKIEVEVENMQIFKSLSLHMLILSFITTKKAIPIIKKILIYIWSL